MLNGFVEKREPHLAADDWRVEAGSCFGGGQFRGAQTLGNRIAKLDPHG